MIFYNGLSNLGTLPAQSGKMRGFAVSAWEPLSYAPSGKVYQSVTLSLLLQPFKAAQA